MISTVCKFCKQYDFISTMKEGSKKEREKERETNSINYIKNDGKKIGKNGSKIAQSLIRFL